MARDVARRAVWLGAAVLAFAAACNGDAEVLDLTPTPTPTATATPQATAATPSPTATPTSTSTPAATPTPAPTAEPTPTSPPTPTSSPAQPPAAPTPTATPRATAAPTQPPATPTPAPSTPTPAQTPSAPSGVTAEIRGFGYPWELEVTAGTTVTWINSDGVPHDVEAYDGSFKSPILGQGESWSRTFSTAGTFAYFCSVHPYMQASVIVR